MFIVNYHDHLDHCQFVYESPSLELARQEFIECLKQPVQPYDYGYELVDDTQDEYETLEFEVVQPEPGN